MRPRVLVAGVGNIFLGDDGFGVEVARHLLDADLPDWVKVGDFGIRGVHLAYELLDGYDTAILVDAVPRGEAPGTIYVLEPETAVATRQAEVTAGAMPLMDAHGMQPDAVLALLASMGGEVRRVLVVGCEPADTEEGIGLSDPVTAAVPEAVRVVRELIEATAADGT